MLLADVQQNYLVRGCTSRKTKAQERFTHLMIHYPDFAFLFFWRIRKRNHFTKSTFTPDIPCKIFGSTKIEGGLICFHPYATVINAKSIGKNFQFRNCLTIGNKHDDNRLLPTIGSDVTVGANVVIIGDITIGDNVIVGAGSVVVKSIPSNSVVAGNPARILKTKD